MLPRGSILCAGACMCERCRILQSLFLYLVFCIPFVKSHILRKKYRIYMCAEMKVVYARRISRSAVAVAFTWMLCIDALHASMEHGLLSLTSATVQRSRTAALSPCRTLALAIARNKSVAACCAASPSAAASPRRLLCAAPPLVIVTFKSFFLLQAHEAAKLQRVPTAAHSASMLSRCPCRTY
jgi:hypothetical protein